MTNDELNTKIYEKLFAEQQEYKGWLLTQSPEDILKHAYEYTIRDDIVLAMEYLDLTDEQAKALIDSEKPLESIFNAFENIEGNHMDDVRDLLKTKRMRLSLLKKKYFVVFPCISILLTLPKSTESWRCTELLTEQMWNVKTPSKMQFPITIGITA